MTRFTIGTLVFSIAVVLAGLAACAVPATPPPLSPRPLAAPVTPTSQPASDAEAIRQLVLLEGQGVVRQDIAGLMNLWATDAVVTDAKHTANTPGDDARWRGRDAIRERYVVLVFPGNPSANSPGDIEVVIEGDRATATSTTRIAQEISPGGDRWSFVKREGRWWIAELTYNLESK
jgi:hypothetical protein